MNKADSNTLDVITDQALTDPTQDKFGRDLFAKRVASILINKQTPDHLTIGIYGKWGEILELPMLPDKSIKFTRLTCCKTKTKCSEYLVKIK